MTSHASAKSLPRQKATRLSARDPKSSPDVVKTLTDLDLEGILDNVGSRYLPTDLNRMELLHDLNSDWNLYQSSQRLKSKSRHTAIRAYAKNVATAANALSEILDQSNEAAEHFRRVVPGGSLFPLNDFRIRLQHLPTVAASVHQAFNGPHPALKAYDDDGPQLPKLRLTPKEFFFAYQLPRSFEKHFKREAGQSRSSTGGPPGGPFIRFAEAVCAAFGQNVAPGSIGKAMTKTSGGVFPR